MQTNYPQNGEGGIIASDWTALISHFGQKNILSFGKSLDIKGGGIFYGSEDVF